MELDELQNRLKALIEEYLRLPSAKGGEQLRREVFDSMASELGAHQVDAKGVLEQLESEATPSGVAYWMARSFESGGNGLDAVIYYECCRYLLKVRRSQELEVERERLSEVEERELRILVKLRAYEGAMPLAKALAESSMSIEESDLFPTFFALIAAALERNREKTSASLRDFMNVIIREYRPPDVAIRSCVRQLEQDYADLVSSNSDPTAWQEYQQAVSRITKEPDLPPESVVG